MSTDKNIINEIKNSLNSSDEGRIAYTMEEENIPSDPVDFISTNSKLLNAIISNHPNKGIPIGRIITIEGLASTGKSLLAYELLKSTINDMNGIGIFYDAERATSKDFIQKMGINSEQLIYVIPSSIERVFDSIDKTVTHINAKNKKNKVPITIVLDSLDACDTISGVEADYSQEGYAGAKRAGVISNALKKIVPLLAINRTTLVIVHQLRMNMNATLFGDKYTVSGGKAPAFYASVRLRIHRTKKIEKKEGVLGSKKYMGVNVKIKVEKNKIAIPFRECESSIIFYKGIDDSPNILQLLVDEGYVSKIRGPKYQFKKTKVEGIKSIINKDNISFDFSKEYELSEIISQIRHNKELEIFIDQLITDFYTIDVNKVDYENIEGLDFCSITP